MTTNSPIETRRVAHELAKQLVEIITTLDAALSNLDDAQPGYATSVIGASPSTARSVEADGLMPVERAASSNDQARNDLRRIHRLVDKLRAPTVELWSLINAWSYTRHTPPLDLANNVEWCDSCLRIQRCEPRVMSRWCAFCGDMRKRFGRLPSTVLLDAHHSGKRISDTMRADDHPRRRAA